MTGFKVNTHEKGLKNNLELENYKVLSCVAFCYIKRESMIL
jgi:hypothetical protein